MSACAGGDQVAEQLVVGDAQVRLHRPAALRHAVYFGLLDVRSRASAAMEMARAIVRMPCPPTPARMRFCSTVGPFQHSSVAQQPAARGRRSQSLLPATRTTPALRRRLRGRRPCRRGLDALALGHDHRQPAVLDGLRTERDVVLVVLGQRLDHVQMLRRHAQPREQVEQLAARRPSSPARRSSPTVPLSRMNTVMSASARTAPISGVMPECVNVESPIVHSDRIRPGLGRAVRHRDRRAHVHARVHRLVRRQDAERVAADVAEQDRRPGMPPSPR